MMDKKTEQLSKLLRCNLILINDGTWIVGISYEKDTDPAPYVIVKDDSSEYYYLYIQTAMALKIPIEKNRPLTRVLFKEANEGDIIPEEYSSSLSVIYKRVYTQKKEQSDFEKQMHRDISSQIYRSQKGTFMRSLKKWSRNQKTVLSDQKKDNSINLKDNLQQLAKTKELEFAESYISSLNMHTFAFEHHDDSKENLDFWLMVVVDINGKIFVRNRYVFQEFDADKASSALELVNAFVGEKETIVQNQKKYIEEFTISPKTSDIAINSIKALLEINSNQNSIDFVGYNDTICVTIYLHKKYCAKMYELTITYKEFLRCPEAFKKLISNPYKLYKWNFWCHGQKFNPKRFAKD